jgi:SHS2 domain-containing protein
MYRWVDHTSEVELEIEAAGEREVLEEALRALTELLGIEGARCEERRTITLHADDRPALLASWIEELVFLAESEGFVATQLVDLSLRPADLTATVTGVLDEPPPLVKAVTYHRLAFEPSGAGYVARVVLDV